MDSLQLTRIEVEGFKSIRKLSLSMEMLNVLIGSNGAGKTNFISLFSFLQAVAAGNLQLYVARHGGPDVFLRFGRKVTERITVRFFFGNNGYGFTLAPTNDNRMMFEREWFYWNMSGEYDLATGHMESKWRDGTGNKIDDFIQPILKKQKWRVYHFHDTSDTAPVKQIHGLNDNIELAGDARNLAAFLYRLREKEPASYKNIVNVIRMAAPYFKDFILRPNPLKEDSIVLEWAAAGSDVPFTAAQLSDGTLRFICLAVLLLQPESLQPETIVIDEPELGLHPYAISLLAGLMKKASVDRQILVSTQSAELLSHFEAKNVVVVNQKGTESEFSRLDEAELMTWLEDDYTLGDLWKQNMLGGRP